MSDFTKTDSRLEALCCHKIFNDGGWTMSCTEKGHQAAFVRTVYSKKQLEDRGESRGLYRYADWLPVSRMLKGSGFPVTYKSKGLAGKLGLSDLYITFNGYWPEKKALMTTGTFKECEAYSVCGRMDESFGKILVVASAGNTARAFARVCSENKIPLLLFVPEDNLDSLWFEEPINSCVKLVSTEKGSDYCDAIMMSETAAALDGFEAEGGAKNVARRDGMATTVYSAVLTIGRIPEYYFQAVGSGTGAIAAWEANRRFIADGRFGEGKMRLMLSQNAPFLLMHDSWKAGKRQLVETDPDTARRQVEKINAKVLSNRKPPYGIIGGLYDALSDTNGDFFSVSNEEAAAAARINRR